MPIWSEWSVTHAIVLLVGEGHPRERVQMIENVWVVTMHVSTHAVEMIVFKDEVKAYEFWEIMNASSIREVNIDAAKMAV